MGLVQDVTRWTTAFFGPLGVWGLFLLAFVEASFFPVPADTLLIVLVLEGSVPWWVLALACTVGSLLGGVFGYVIGYWGEEAVLKRWFSEKKIMRLGKLLQRYENAAVFIAGFTPLPYKLVTIGAGVFHLRFVPFVVTSFVSRALRFFLVAYFVYVFGPSLIALLDKYLLLFALVSVGVLGVLIVREGKKALRKKKKK